MLPSPSLQPRRSVATIGRLPLEQAAGIVVAVCTSVDEHHSSGRSHGAVSLEGIFLCADGHIELADATGAAAPADDVAALGVVLDRLLQRVPPAPSNGRRLRGLLSRPDPLVSLQVLADRCQGPDAAGRPTAGGMATAIIERVPTARLPLPGATLGAGAIRRAGAGVIGGAGAVGGAGVLGGAGAIDHSGVIGGAGETGRDGVTVRPADGSAIASGGAGHPLSGQLAVDEGGSGGYGQSSDRMCGQLDGAEARLEDARSGRRRGSQRPARTDRTVLLMTAVVGLMVAAGVTAYLVARLVPSPSRPSLTDRAAPPTSTAAPDYHDGVLTVDGASFAVGQPGDVEATSDWTCTGQPTVALLRPGTGEVFVFQSWASAGRDITANAIGRVDHAVGLRPEPRGDEGCPSLVVVRDGMAPVSLRVPAAQS